MKTLIISDLHLGTKSEPHRLQYLQELLSAADAVIINGDFWDLYTDTFEAFITSPWKVLFPLLKSKHAIYIEGNHDHARDTGQEVHQFCDQHLSEYVFKSGDLTLHVEHGHKKTHKKHDTSPWIISSFRTIKYNVWFRDPLEKVLISQNNDSLHRWHMAKSEKTILDYAHQLPKNHILVTGHTHLPTFQPENHYINTGYINHSIAYYLLVEEGTLTYIKEEYAPSRKILFKQVYP